MYFNFPFIVKLQYILLTYRLSQERKGKYSPKIMVSTKRDQKFVATCVSTSIMYQTHVPNVGTNVYTQLWYRVGDMQPSTSK